MLSLVSIAGSALPLVLINFLTLFPHVLSVCTPATANCASCLNANDCGVCDPGFYPDLIAGFYVCMACPLGCSDCTSGTACTACRSTFLMNDSMCECPAGQGPDLVARLCSSCPTDCDICNANYLQCQKCASSRGLTGSLACLACATTFCGKCQADYTVCQKCRPNYGPDATNTNCLPCADGPQCYLCYISSDDCIQCATGYVANGGDCYLCTAQNCITCTPDRATCTSCRIGYTFHGTFCSNCPDPLCVACSPTPTVCTQCINPYGPDASGSCVACADTLCKLCHLDYLSCSVCETNSSTGVGLGACIPCLVLGCINCPYDYMICWACGPGNGLVGSSCQPCSLLTHCVQCSPSDGTVCVLCELGYGLDPTSCQVCPSNCLTCLNDYLHCDLCAPFYGVLFGIDYSQCEPCTVSGCSSCEADHSICKACNPGYYFSTFPSPTGNCLPCDDSNCLFCFSSSSICDICRPGYGVVSGSCYSCLNSNCATCTPDINTCTQCLTHFGVLAGSCSPCPTNCINCGFDALACTQCMGGYGVVGSGCVSCVVVGCTQCNGNISCCDGCADGYFVSAGTCSLCQVNCWRCSDGISCDDCVLGYGLTTSTVNTCQVCDTPQCQDCHPDKAVCLSCLNGFGLDVGMSCLPCQGSCLTCSKTDFLLCLTCKAGDFLDPSTSLCSACISLCLSCQNITHCDQCAPALYFDTSCIPCPIHCTDCTLFNSTSATCTACQSMYQLDNGTPASCTEICGDGVTFQYACDNEIGVDWDGCDDGCREADGFGCQVHADGSSVCSYMHEIGMEVVGFARQPGANSFVMRVRVVPPLHVFSQQSAQQLKSSFIFQEDYMTISTISYSESILTLTAEFSQTLTTPFTLLFLPLNSTRPEYYLSPAQTLALAFTVDNDLLVHYSSQSFSIALIIEYICYAAAGLAWLGWLVGVGCRRLAGLEAMLVVQVGFVTLVEMSGYFHLPYQRTLPLKYSTGYNLALFPEQPLSSTSAQHPYTSQYQLSPLYLSNNYNLSLVLQFVMLLPMLVTYLRHRRYQHTYLQQNGYDRGKLAQCQQYDRLLGWYEWIAQVQLQVVSVNFVYFILCVSVYFQQAEATDAASLGIMGAEGLLLVLMLVLFCRDPHSFDYFRYSFRIDSKALMHYHVELGFVVLVSVLDCALAFVSYTGAIPCVAIFIYVTVTKPYSYRRQNWRALLNITVIALFIGVKMVGQYCSTDIMVVSMFLLLGVLSLVVVAVVGLVSSIYYWYYEKYVLPRLDEQDRKLTGQINYRRVLNQLRLVKVNEKMRKNEHKTVFKDIVSPQVSLLKQSDLLQIYKRGNEAVDKEEINMLFKQSQRWLYHSRNNPSAALHQAMPRQPGDTPHISLRMDLMKQIRMGKHDETRITDYDKLLVPVADNEEQLDGRRTHNKLKIETEREIAERVVLEQNLQISLKGTVDLVGKIKKKALKDDMKGGWMAAYENIG